ncbi:hypothetical protein E2562_009064 [Oryza meyeriana var. granulata]|uniref:Uncharacterized protein n=1 Tax=Oryza meyeriana var. granulata TaxID=110450 RepID=A0A6G1D1N3_9ORYZ|nr:hypothetical protein E2562_009064 [Oryza meyeriana var. granulata]
MVAAWAEWRWGEGRWLGSSAFMALAGSGVKPVGIRGTGGITRRQRAQTGSAGFAVCGRVGSLDATGRGWCKAWAEVAPQGVDAAVQLQRDPTRMAMDSSGCSWRRHIADAQGMGAVATRFAEAVTRAAVASMARQQH